MVQLKIEFDNKNFKFFFKHFILSKEYYSFDNNIGKASTVYQDGHIQI